MYHMKTVLFICTHNSARSQMAEGLVNHIYGNQWTASSAGTEKTSVKPLAIAAMREMGIDISHHRSQHIDEFLTIEIWMDLRRRNWQHLLAQGT